MSISEECLLYVCVKFKEREYSKRGKLDLLEVIIEWLAIRNGQI